MTAPITGNEDLDAFLYALGQQSNATGVVDINGRLEVDGTFIGYKYKHIHIKYADDNIGTNLADTPTNRFYYGIRNTDDTDESLNAADYTWYQVTDGFGTTKKLYYQLLGGRRVEFQVSATSPGASWKIDPGSITNIDVQQLSDLSTNLGTITAGNAILGNNPAISGTKMTGSGIRIQQLSPSNTSIGIGNSNRSIVFNGNTVTINGFQASVATNVTNVPLTVDPNPKPTVSYSYRHGEDLITFTAKSSRTLYLINGYIDVTPINNPTFRFRLSWSTYSQAGFSSSSSATGVCIAGQKAVVPVSFSGIMNTIEGQEYTLGLAVDSEGFFKFKANTNTGEIEYVYAMDVTTEASVKLNVNTTIYQIEV